ncbi:hypothetical protein GS845_06085 [Rhodococcus hoagii]|nr:hypothetical protein [Prescottella equi]
MRFDRQRLTRRQAAPARCVRRSAGPAGGCRNRRHGRRNGSACRAPCPGRRIRGSLRRLEHGPDQVQIQWAARGGDAALYLLDGLRARDDANAWTFETNALEQYRLDNLTLVIRSADSRASTRTGTRPATSTGRRSPTSGDVPDRGIPAYLETRGVSRTNNGVLGLSMGGSAALTLAAYHRDQFKFAGSLSGYLHISAPGMREAIRIAMLDAGRYNVDSMWGPPWSPNWLRNDPFVFAPSSRACRCTSRPPVACRASTTPEEGDRLLQRRERDGPGGAVAGQHSRLPAQARLAEDPRDLQLPGQRHPRVGLLVRGTVEGPRPDPEHSERVVTSHDVT